MKSMIHSYPSVCAMGHKMISEIFKGDVLVEEKIDGSQFSFGVLDGELTCRSKGAQIIIDAPEQLFNEAVATAKELAPRLIPDKIYRGEYLKKPKHNALAYDRVPAKHIILFDIQSANEGYLSYSEKKAEADRLGLEVVPFIFEGTVQSADFLKGLLERVSILGGSKIEGVVVKNYNIFTADKKVAMGKFVSEAFKEVHNGEWRKANPTSVDIVTGLICAYKTPARWHKAIQHLRDAGLLENSPKDIGKLIKEVPEDILKECGEEIKDKLFSHFWPQIKRGITAGMPEWYKELLLESAFEEDNWVERNEGLDNL